MSMDENSIVWFKVEGYWIESYRDGSVIIKIGVVDEIEIVDDVVKVNGKEVIRNGESIYNK